jgi:DNA polymerase-3 subunit chi
MGTVLFYQLLRSGPVDLLAINLPRALGQGWPVMIRGTDPAALERLDAALWLVGGAHDAGQPVLLGTGAARNSAKVLALVDGAEAEEAEIAALERVWVLFDGNDDTRLQAARAQWKAVTGSGHAAQYWSEESGRWEKKAESPGS